MRMLVYILSAATAVSVPSVVANRMGMRIGDLSMFASEEEVVPEEEAEQLVSYEERIQQTTTDPEAPVEVDEDMLPIHTTMGRSYVALPDMTVIALRDKFAALPGQKAKKTEGDH